MRIVLSLLVILFICSFLFLGQGIREEKGIEPALIDLGRLMRKKNLFLTE